MLSLLMPINMIAADNSYSWYCKRVKDNLQPPLPAEFGFIENYPCIWLDRSGGKKVYLTFDAGYENGNVEKILDVLKSKNVKGAFFILLNLIDANPDLVKRMSDEGHLVCNHTAHHKNMSKISDPDIFKAELDILSDAYFELTKKQLSPYFRPPEGTFSESNLKTIRDFGYKTVFWSLAYVDWNNDAQPTAQQDFEKVLPRNNNGALVLLHCTSTTNADRPSTKRSSSAATVPPEVGLTIW